MVFPVSRLPTDTQLINLERGDEWLRAFDVHQDQNKHMIDELLKGL